MVNGRCGGRQRREMRQLGSPGWTHGEWTLPPFTKKPWIWDMETGLAFFLKPAASYYINPMGSTCEFCQLFRVGPMGRYHSGSNQLTAVYCLCGAGSTLRISRCFWGNRGKPLERVSRWGWWWRVVFDASMFFFGINWKLSNIIHYTCIISDVSNMEWWSKFMDWNVSTYWSSMIWPKLCRSFLYLEASLRFLDP